MKLKQLPPYDRDCPRCGHRNPPEHDPIYSRDVTQDGRWGRTPVDRWMPPKECERCAADLRGLPLVELPSDPALPA